MKLWENSWTPMLLSEKLSPFQDKNYLYEIKFDGIRALLFVNSKKVIIKNRHGKDITKRFPELQEIKQNISQNTIFDGEIVVFENNRPMFSGILKRLHQNKEEKITILKEKNPVVYMCFDLLYEGKDITQKPLKKRKERLENYQDTDNFIKVKSFENGLDLFKQIQKFDLEGMVAKRKNSTYKIDTRTDDWIKIKKQKEEIFYIGGYLENQNAAVISLLLGEFQNNQLKYVGKVSMAKKNPLYQQIKKQKLRKTSPLKGAKENANFISPKFTCFVKYLERTEKGTLRHPIFQKGGRFQ